MFADIVVDIAAGELDKVFQYRVPKALESKISVGVRAVIPFGKGNRKIEGYVIGLPTVPSYPEEKIKDIESIIDDGISVEQQLITLAANIKTVYGSTMAAALKTVIPVKKQVRAVERKEYRLNISLDESKALLEKFEKDRRRASSAVLLRALMCQESLSRTAILQNLGVSAAVLKNLTDKGIIAEERCRVYRKPLRVQANAAAKNILNDEQQAAVEGILEKPGSVHLLHGVTGSGKTEVYMSLVAQTVAKGQQVIVLIPEISLTLQTVSRFYQLFGDRVSVMNSRLSAGERYDQYMRAKEGDVDIIVGPRSALFMPFERLGMIIIDEEHDGAYKSETTPKYHAREVAIWRSRLCGATVVLGSATPSIDSYHKAVTGFYHLHRLTQRAVADSAMAAVHVVDLREEFKLKNKKIFSGQLTEMIAKRLQRKEQVMLFLNRRGYAGFVSCRNCGFVIKCRHCDVSMTAHYDGSLKCHYCGYEQPMPKTCPACGSKYIAAFGTGTQKVETMVSEDFPDAKVLRLDKDTTSKKDSTDTILSDFKNGDADILVGTQMIVKGHDFPKVTLVGILAADLSMFSGDYMAAERTFGLLVQAAGRAGRGNLPGDVVIQTYQPDNYSIVCAAKQDYDSFYQQEIVYRQMMHYPPFYNILAVLGECQDEKRLSAAMEHIRRIAEEMTAQPERKMTAQPEKKVAAQPEKKMTAQSGIKINAAGKGYPVMNLNPPEISRAGANMDFENQSELIGPANAFVSKAKDAYRKVIYIKCRKMRPLIQMMCVIEQMVKSHSDFNKVYVQFDMNPMSMY